MNLKTITGAGFSSNSYLIIDNKVALIDPGMHLNSIHAVSEVGQLDLIINTHIHFDHSANNKLLQDRYNCDIAMGRAEADFFSKNPDDALAGDFFDFEKNVLDYKITKRLDEGNVIDLGQTKLKVINTPGHTIGGICLYSESEKILFTGDTIFFEGVGRTDLPGGDSRELKRSLRKLQAYETEVFYPGHGPEYRGNIGEKVGDVIEFIV